MKAYMKKRRFKIFVYNDNTLEYLYAGRFVSVFKALRAYYKQWKRYRHMDAIMVTMTTDRLY